MASNLCKTSASAGGKGEQERPTTCAQSANKLRKRAAKSVCNLSKRCVQTGSSGQAKFTVNSPLKLAAAGKLNLGLRVLHRHPSGYHELETIYQLIDLCDQVTLHPRPDGQLHLDCSGAMAAGLANDKSNLAMAAALLLRQQTGGEQGADIHLYKEIPSGAGMGGGSSDAAAVLVGLNHLWQLQLSRKELAHMGLQLGADVPFFLYGRNACGRGVGEQLIDAHLPPCHYLLATAADPQPTASLFAQLDGERARTNAAERLPQDMTASLTSAVPGFENDFEELVLCRSAPTRRLWQRLSAFGQPRLSGTGGGLFLTFCDDKQALQTMRSLEQNRRPSEWLHLARGIQVSPLYANLYQTPQDGQNIPA